ncbi:MAG: polyprenyl diphosphate synthase [Candidatus Pacebacteria bacterium]|nr:polyprenyl diphosphate synthase [Candidatus Paceibacterota bacterium]
MAEKAKNVPYHLGIIIDGNRRWAREKGLPTFEGHRQGYNKLKKVGKWCKAKGIKILTIFAFSSENWNRSKDEVSYLMRLLAQAFSKKEVDELNKDGIKLRVIGQKERLDKNLQKMIEEAEEKTKNNKEGILNLAISYGGRPELIEAIKKIIKQKISPEKITEEIISQNLWTEGMPDPDLLIRTSGEQRTSGFLTWQSAYAELYFCKKYWPDFSEKDLDDALLDYARRQRRFGK